MKKTGLHDMKRRNRRLVLEEILRRGRVSRTDLASATELSPSTVSGLVGELLEEGLLLETGAAASTGGRPRVELGLDPDYGFLGVLEIGRAGATLHRFDMCLGKLSSERVAASHVQGNELLAAIGSAIGGYRDGPAGRRLVGLGLLFDEDTQPADFSVVYSTSLSSASISLREALLSEYRVTVCEDYSRLHSIAEALSGLGTELATNSLHVSLGERVLATVVLDGAPVALRGGARLDLGPLLADAERALTAVTAGEAVRLEAEALPAAMVGALASVIATFCRIFDLDTVILSGAPASSPVLSETLACMIARLLGPLPAPRVHSERPAIRGPEDSMASALRAEALLA